MVLSRRRAMGLSIAACAPTAVTAAPRMSTGSVSVAPTGGRLPALDEAALTTAQHAVRRKILADTQRPEVSAPFAVLLRVPFIADGAIRLWSGFRYEGKLPPRLFELMVITVARHWNAQFEWTAHAPRAIEAGVPAGAVEAIRLGRRPALEDARDAAVYDTVRELSEQRALSTATYQRALGLLGEEGLVELVGAAGLYTMIAMTLQAFDVPGMGHERPLL